MTQPEVVAALKEALAKEAAELAAKQKARLEEIEAQIRLLKEKAAASEAAASD